MKKLIECVPNFSEGKDMGIINQITDQIEIVEGVRLLDVDPGKATNRTVVTMIGSPDAIVEAAFLAIKKASLLIDMRRHKGEHPRMGATDVCPLIPVSGISMEETVIYARKLAERVGTELGIPVYCYEKAAFIPERANLAYCRSGEYEGLPKKLSKPEWKPDFGPDLFNELSGATAIGAREFLIAYNINLNTTSTRRANAVAYDIREKGRPQRENGCPTGKIMKDESGNEIWIPGTLKACKAIGWYIEEYGIAQVSINLTDINITPLHIAFEEACKMAEKRGLRVTGSELVGLIPLRSMIEAGKYFLKKQNRSVGIAEEDIIRIAVKSLGLNDLKPFKPEEKIIEYLIQDTGKKKLINLTCKEFADETASESPAPGGGSIAAYIGTLGVSLGTMVANLSSHKAGWDSRWEEFSDWAEKGQQIKDDLLRLVDEDTQAFNKLIQVYGLPKGSEEEKAIRIKAIQEAVKYATEVPLKTMQRAYDAFELIKAMVLNGNSNSVTDAGVGALCLRSAIMGAYMNVRINASGLSDVEYRNKLLSIGEEIENRAVFMEKEITEMVNNKIK